MHDTKMYHMRDDTKYSANHHINHKTFIVWRNNLARTTSVEYLAMYDFKVSDLSD